MINKSSLVLVAALVAGSAGVASADPMIDDVNSGLPTLIYNAPLAQLQQQGLPVKASAAAYVQQHSQHGTVSVHRTANASKNFVRTRDAYQAEGYAEPEDKQSGHF